MIHMTAKNILYIRWVNLAYVNVFLQHLQWFDAHSVINVTEQVPT
jgi:hypothetical protein